MTMILLSVSKLASHRVVASKLALTTIPKVLQ